MLIDFLIELEQFTEGLGVTASNSDIDKLSNILERAAKVLGTSERHVLRATLFNLVLNRAQKSPDLIKLLSCSGLRQLDAEVSLDCFSITRA